LLPSTQKKSDFCVKLISFLNIHQELDFAIGVIFPIDK